MKLPIALVLFVLLGLWVAQTDCFPFEQGIRPSWYLYGWPICFATSGRERFGFATFQLLPFLIDSVISVLMLICTYIATRQLERSIPFTLIDAFAATAGVALTLMVVTGNYVELLNWASFPPATIGVSEMDGNARPFQQTLTLAVPSICIGSFSIGFVVASATINLANPLKSGRTSDSNAG